MRFLLNGREEWLPADWMLQITVEGGSARVMVSRKGELIPLSQALVLRDLETTSSNSYNKRPIE